MPKPGGTSRSGKRARKAPDKKSGRKPPVRGKPKKKTPGKKTARKPAVPPKPKKSRKKKAKKKARANPDVRRDGGGIDEGRMTPADLAGAMGVGPDVIDRHVAEGAPVDDAGRLHIVEYAAWLNREIRGPRDR